MTRRAPGHPRTPRTTLAWLFAAGGKCALGCLLGVAICALAASEGRANRTETGAYRNPTPGAVLALQIPGMHRASVRRGIVYRVRGGQRLRLDVYRPRNTSRPLPVVLLGGPPQYDAGKDSGQKIGWSQLIAASGLAAVAFDIRSDNFLSTPHAPSRDVEAAIAYVRAHAAGLGLDVSRLCTLGFSIGTAPWHLWAVMRRPEPYVRCNVVYYGPLDFQDASWSIDRRLAEEFSALTYLRRHGSKIAPMLIAKAGRETFDGINESIDRFVEAAQEEGADVELVTHRRGGHAFDERERTGASRRIVRRTLDYFRARLQP